MHQTLLVIHFIGLAMGVGMSFFMLAMSFAAGRMEPATAGTFMGQISRPAGTVRDIGFILLVVTGFAMIWTDGYAEAGALGLWFWLKMAGVLGLAGVIGGAHVLQARIRRGDTGAAATMRNVARVGLLLSILTVTFAVLTFS